MARGPTLQGRYGSSFLSGHKGEEESLTVGLKLQAHAMENITIRNIEVLA